MKTILIAVDLSDLSVASMDLAAQIALPLKSRLILLHVVEPPISYLGEEFGATPVVAELPVATASLHSDLEAMASHLRSQGLAVETKVAIGAIVETILDQAAILAADLLVIGSHNHGAVYRALIGSTSVGVVKHSQLPVLVVPGHKAGQEA